MPSLLAPVDAATTPSAAVAVATASAVFLSSTAIASALGGLTGSLGGSVLGLPPVFFAPALYGLIASGVIAVMSRCRFAGH
jgi:MFS transporter, SET family, sugar efflux transporter